jgi:hypothetical protein
MQEVQNSLKTKVKIDPWQALKTKVKIDPWQAKHPGTPHKNILL